MQPGTGEVTPPTRFERSFAWSRTSAYPIRATRQPETTEFYDGGRGATVPETVTVGQPALVRSEGGTSPGCRPEQYRSCQ
jgi:hypothetical protein